MELEGSAFPNTMDTEGEAGETTYGDPEPVVLKYYVAMVMTGFISLYNILGCP